jgi:hypothetical protein
LELQQFFKLCKSKSKEYLTIKEFSELYKNPKSDDLFRFFIKRSRKINAELKEKGSQKIFLPFSLSRFLESVAVKSRRDTVAERIESQLMDYEKMVDMVKNFVKLFMIDEGAVESITNDEWSKKIDRAIQK